MASTEVKKRDYNVIAGETHTMEASRGDAITAQPSATSGVENYIIDLDAQQVGRWSPEEVINNFVERIGLGYLNEVFLANKITGRALILLNEGHLKEMGIQAIGDRVYMLDMITLLKKKKKELDTSATLWSGETPAPGCEDSMRMCELLEDCTRVYELLEDSMRVYELLEGSTKAYELLEDSTRVYELLEGHMRMYELLEDCMRHTAKESVIQLVVQSVLVVSTAPTGRSHLKVYFTERCQHSGDSMEQRYSLEMFVEDKDAKATSKDPGAGEFAAPHILLHPEAAKVEQVQTPGEARYADRRPTREPSKRASCQPIQSNPTFISNFSSEEAAGCNGVEKYEEDGRKVQRSDDQDETVKPTMKDFRWNSRFIKDFEE
eukprot:gene12135-13388_t